MRKKTAILVATVSLASTLCAQVPEITGTFPDGRLLLPADTLFDKNTCVFSLDNGEDAEWTVMLEGDFGKPLPVAAATGNSVTLSVTPALMDDYKNDWWDLKRYYSSSGNLYFKGYAQALTSGEQPDSLPFLLRVYPRKPYILNASLHYDSFDKTCSVPYTGWFCGATIAPEVQVYDALHVAWLWSYPECSVNVMSYCFVNGDTIVKMPEYEWLIDQGYWACVSNAYGSIYSDTIFVNDYIDPDIMSYIDDYYAQANSISEVDGHSGSNSLLQLDPEERILAVAASDMGGRPLPVHTDANGEVAVEGHGLAVLRVKTDKRTITKKVRL